MWFSWGCLPGALRAFGEWVVFLRWRKDVDSVTGDVVGRGKEEDEL